MEGSLGQACDLYILSVVDNKSEQVKYIAQSSETSQMYIYNLKQVSKLT